MKVVLHAVAATVALASGTIGSPRMPGAYSVDVPFDFVANGVELKAGTYHVENLPHNARISSSDRKQVVVVSTSRRVEKYHTNAQMIFDASAGMPVLTAMRPPESGETRLVVSLR